MHARSCFLSRSGPMRGTGSWAAVLIASLVVASLVGPAARSAAQSRRGGTVAGIVLLDLDGSPVHGAVVFLIGPGRFVTTDAQGRFVLTDVPEGQWEILAQREHLTAERQAVTVRPGETTTVTFRLKLSPIHEEITVTATPATGRTTFEAFNAITTLDTFALAVNRQGTLGEVLEQEPGVARRSFGPGSSRPIIRGFDGDRVLIMEDGTGTGDLSSQSGDHGVPIDPSSLDRVEVVRGPATLLYGSNAIGGVVHAVTPQESFRTAPRAGLQGQVTADVGSADRQLGSNAGFQYGAPSARWLLWGAGGGRRTSDYQTPLGPVTHSRTRASFGRVGVGYAGARLFVSVESRLEDGRNGVPFAGVFHGEGAGEDDDRRLSLGPAGEAEEPVPLVDIDWRRRAGRVDVGLRNLGTAAVEGLRVIASVTDWVHEELETVEGRTDVATRLTNRTFSVRAEATQRPMARLSSGKFGVSAELRRFGAAGEEALAPTTEQTGLAAFAYEELTLGRYRVEVGGRVEHRGYDVTSEAPRGARDRQFTGVSGSVGVRAELAARSAFVANLTRSFRAPALEELYNFGPHVGNLAFEVGNPDLAREAALGVDLSLRHRTARARGNVNAYVYQIDNFVFLDVTDDREDGLPVAFFRQGDSRFVGLDAVGSLQVREGVWLHGDVGYVRASLTHTGEPLPRIPPLKGRVGVEVHLGGLSVTPELAWAARQARVHRGEAPTDGWAVFNLRVAHVWARPHAAHMLGVTIQNVTDALYRNHTSFIKALAPEAGRGVRLAYTLRFF
jgi:iron complex outermembrane receptor protein